MTDHPIMFSAPMVQALLAGRKTQTRRLAWRECKPGKVGVRNTGRAADDGSGIWENPSSWQTARPSDRLWVREAWGLLPRNCYALPKTPAPDKDFAAYYRADFDRCGKPAWRPSIHMPRWASRLTLTVTDVRVQRVQEISEADALAEGMEATICLPQGPGAPGMRPRFAILWDHLHGPGAWDANPEVVALTFTAAQRNIDDADG